MIPPVACDLRRFAYLTLLSLAGPEGLFLPQVDRSPAPPDLAPLLGRAGLPDPFLRLHGSLGREIQGELLPHFREEPSLKFCNQLRLTGDHDAHQFPTESRGIRCPVDPCDFPQLPSFISIETER